MRKANQIKYIVLHCSAGFGNIESMRAFWKSKGWLRVGYHIVVDLEGNPHVLLPFDQVSNGVLGFNTESINICYIGGVENVGTAKKPIWKGKDTRTEQQKIALQNAVVKAVEWLRENGNDCSNVTILGHRDFSPDQNGNGKIESWERIKECPSFDVIPEFAGMQNALNNKVATLPKKK